MGQSKSVAIVMVEAFKELCERDGRTPSKAFFILQTRFSSEEINNVFGSYISLMKAAARSALPEPEGDPSRKAKVLFLDIETLYMTVRVWRPGEQYISHDQMDKDWNIISWAAKWLGSDQEVMYQDNRKAKHIRCDKQLLKGIWKLLDEADVIVTQNGKGFDIPKLFARFIINGMQPPSSFKQIDTKLIAKKHFGFTSASLAYMLDKLGVKYKKLKHKKFPGMELWEECEKGNIEAWNEMELYNKHDVLGLEELWEKLRPWDNSVNFNLFTDTTYEACKCGGEYIKNGYAYTSVGRYQRYRCFDCGAELRGRENLFTKKKKASIKTHIAR